MSPPQDARIAFLVDQLERAHAGDPWHGPSRTSLLEDVSAAMARQRPPSGVHSIWELVLHMTAWTREVARRVREHEARDPEMGDWPPVPARADDAAWRNAMQALDAAHADLVAVVGSLDAEGLTRRIGDARNRALGTGLTVEQTVNGLVQHDAYHSGQIAVVRRMIEKD